MEWRRIMTNGFNSSPSSIPAECRIIDPLTANSSTNLQRSFFFWFFSCVEMHSRIKNKSEKNLIKCRPSWLSLLSRKSSEPNSWVSKSWGGNSLEPTYSHSDYGGSVSENLVKSLQEPTPKGWRERIQNLIFHY